MKNQLIIRKAIEQDIPSIYSIVEEIYKNEQSFTLNYNEWQSESEESKIQNFKNRINHKKGVCFVALFDEELVGYIYTNVSPRLRLQHNQRITMGVKNSKRGMGIGKTLFSELIKWANNNPEVEKLSLGVLSINSVAINLYKSFGFIEEGRLVKEYKFSDDTYVDDILMAYHF